MSNPRIPYVFSIRRPKPDAPGGRETIPDVPNFSRADYGLRSA